ncbi:hypothetical protein PTKIN_Ptkin17bG0104700 [Pterospermum kingtungense]
MEKMRVEGLIALGLLLCGSLWRVEADESSLANECSKDLQSVMTCLTYAQGKVTTPTKECCDSVSSIMENDPKCLCYILQQTQSSGAQSLKSLGVQQDKLLLLPSACQLKNASITECPKLLGLSPSSPDAAIFTNSTTTKTTPTTSESSASEKSSDSKSGGTKLGTHLLGSTLLVASAIFFCAFPAGVDSLSVLGVHVNWDPSEL